MFHFAGTLGSSEAQSSHIVLQQVSHQLEHKTKVKYNPFAKLTISDKRQHAKEEQQVCVGGGGGRRGERKSIQVCVGGEEGERESIHVCVKGEGVHTCVCGGEGSPCMCVGGEGGPYMCVCEGGGSPYMCVWGGGGRESIHVCVHACTCVRATVCVCM